MNLTFPQIVTRLRESGDYLGFEVQFPRMADQCAESQSSERGCEDLEERTHRRRLARVLDRPRNLV
jgi:hypothetical protein